VTRARTGTRSRPGLSRPWVLVALAVTALRVDAQARPPVTLALPASTRAAAMGDAFGISLVDSDAVFYNAAFNDRLRGAGFSLAMYGDHSTLYTLSAGTDWLGGAIGFGVQSLDYDVVAGGVAGPSTADFLFGESGTDVAERVLALVYGRRVKGLRLAFTAKHFEQRVPGEQQRLLLGDLATSFTYRFLSVGAAVQNLGPPDYELSGDTLAVPLRGLLNLATVRSYPVGPLDVAASAALSYVRDGEVSPAAGVELSYYPVTGRTFFVRAGLRRPEEGAEPFTLGGGFAGDKIILDYALEPFEGGRRAHRFGVKWR
jgi:hypothetical protein